LASAGCGYFFRTFRHIHSVRKSFTLTIGRAAWQGGPNFKEVRHGKGNHETGRRLNEMLENVTRFGRGISADGHAALNEMLENVTRPLSTGKGAEPVAGCVGKKTTA
jgi:hypothetical protein